MERINIAEKFACFSEQWQPKIVAEVNGQEVKLVKVQGTFPWHHHDDVKRCFWSGEGDFASSSGTGLSSWGQASLSLCPAMSSIAPLPTKKPSDPVGAGGHLEYWERYRRQIHGSHVHEDLRTPVSDRLIPITSAAVPALVAADGSAPKSQEGR